MNTGYLQVKYQLLKQWPIVSADLGSLEELFKVDINVQVQKNEQQDSLEKQMENV